MKQKIAIRIASMSNRQVVLTLIGIFAVTFGTLIAIGMYNSAHPTPSYDFVDSQSNDEGDDSNVSTNLTTNTDSSTEIADPTITIGQENALDKATSYIEFSDFSQHSLRKQLEFEGFTSEEIDYALEYVPADYEQEASDRALAYYTTQSLSRTGVRNQLEYEGFTNEQIEYAISSLPE